MALDQLYRQTRLPHASTAHDDEFVLAQKLVALAPRDPLPVGHLLWTPCWAHRTDDRGYQMGLESLRATRMATWAAVLPSVRTGPISPDREARAWDR